MEKQKLLNYIKKMTTVLDPVISQYKNFIEFVEESELTDDQVLAVKLWFVSACIVATFDKDNKDAKIIIKKAMENMKGSEKFLDEDGDFEDVHDILMDEFKDNCKDWFKVIVKSSVFKPFLKNSQADDEEVEEVEEEKEAIDNKKLPKWFVSGMELTMKILGKILSKEEDIDDLLAKMKDDELKQGALFFLVCSLLGLHLESCLTGKEELPEISPFAKDPKFALKYFQQEYLKMKDVYSKTLNNFDAFKYQINDIIDTHYREFLKKMYREINKEINK